jgi:MYXO-CTERM domain-containing protein
VLCRILATSMKRLVIIIAGLALAGTLFTAFAGTQKLGPAALALISNSPDGFAFLALGLGLLVMARRRDSVTHSPRSTSSGFSPRMRELASQPATLAIRADSATADKFASQSN